MLERDAVALISLEGDVPIKAPLEPKKPVVETTPTAPVTSVKKKQQPTLHWSYRVPLPKKTSSSKKQDTKSAPIPAAKGKSAGNDAKRPVTSKAVSNVSTLSSRSKKIKSKGSIPAATTKFSIKQ